jgi:hypothetical protein
MPSASGLVQAAFDNGAGVELDAAAGAGAAGAAGAGATGAGAACGAAACGVAAVLGAAILLAAVCDHALPEMPSETALAKIKPAAKRILFPSH